MRRPRLAPGFTAIVDGDSLWLVAGEDVRYRLRLADPSWLAALIARCDGTRTVDELATHADARSTIERLFEERVLVEGTAAQAHVPVADIEVFEQDSLDHRALLAMNRRMLDARRRWMWITTGPGGRAYVGPLFVPDAGPCAACLLVHFKRLSPAPELYDAILAHDGPIAATPLPDEARATVAALARWKLSLAANPMAPALYALHVVELADLTITAHVPLIDVECTECR
jgi:bacteriocin biosynthesis cyclodehydratase domain-containing protein